jgi:predicted Zn-dependent protease
MKNELTNKFDEAVRLKEARDFDGARRILLHLHQRDPSSPTLLAVLGHVCWEMKRLDEAISIFQQAIVLRPNSEAVSLGLFHCLWESDRKDDAFDEMKRFLAGNTSTEYKRLLTDINKE